MATKTPQMEAAEDQARRHRALEDEVASVAGVRNAADAALVGLTATALAEGFWQGWRLHSPVQWVMWRAGVTRSTAQRVVAVARRVGELPVTMEAFTRGRLSLDQAATVARYTPARFDATVCELAVMCTVAQIVKATRQYDFDTQAKLADGPEPGDDEPQPDPPPPEADRTVSFGTGDDGAWWAQMHLPADEGMAFEAALKAVRDRLHAQAREAAKARAVEDGTPAKDVTVPHVSWADAAVGMAHAVITGGAAGAETAARARVLMHLEIPRTYGLSNCTCSCGDTTSPGTASVSVSHKMPSGGTVSDPEQRVRRPSRRTGATVNRRCGDPRRALVGDDAGPGTVGDGACVGHDATGHDAATMSTGATNEVGGGVPASGPNPDRDSKADPKRTTSTAVDAGCGCRCHRPGWMGSLHLGGVLPDELRRYLTCDASVEVVWEKDTTPVNLGRSKHIVPPRIRKLIEHRDRGCRVPGCDQSWWLQIHHIWHWEDGGPTDTHNLICLCSRHHRLHHKGFLGISGNADDPDGVTFTDQNGRRMNGVARARPPVAADMPTVKPYACPLGERLHTDCVYFTPSPKPPPDEPHDDDPGDIADPAPDVGPHTRRRRDRCGTTGRPASGPPDGSRAPPMD